MNKHIWVKFYRDGRFERQLTFAEAEIIVEARVRSFQRCGIGPGDRVILKVPNSVETLVTLIALRRCGAIVVPLNPRLGPTTTQHIVDDCAPRFEILADGTVTTPYFGRTSNIASTYAAQIETIIYTSGTTGRPKGVCLSTANWLSNAKALQAHHKLDETSVIASPLPLFHCNAHGFALYTTYLAGCTLVLFDKTPLNFLDILEEERVTVASVVPAILHTLIASQPQWRPHAAFRYFLTAAAPLSPELFAALRSQWMTRVIQGYGLTESTNFSCTMPIELDDRTYERIMIPQPSIGVAIPGSDVEIFGSSREDQCGELVIRSESNSIGYWGQALSGREAVRTGDIGYYRIFNNRRFYYLVGRIKEVINRGGEKLYPLELEAELRSHGVPDEHHVFAFPDERLGEDVAVAVTQFFAPALLDSIPSYRRPKHIYKISAFPKTPTGKLQRQNLRDLCLAGGDGVEKLK